MVFLKEFLFKNDFEKIQKMTKKSMKKYPVGKELKYFLMAMPLWSPDYQLITAVLCTLSNQKYDFCIVLFG